MKLSAFKKPLQLAVVYCITKGLTKVHKHLCSNGKSSETSTKVVAPVVKTPKTHIRRGSLGYLGPKGYECKQCLESFSRQSMLTWHVEKVHDE